jgi:UDP-N-acetylmuramoyl-tripeptide--D-alanyl-D-alanine ligase
VSCTITHGDSSATLKIEGIIGLQHTYAAAAGVAVASHLGITLESAVAGLALYTTPPGRMRVFPGIKGTVIIDDTYNSSPVAAEHAIETMVAIKHTKRRIAVMGDMLELGKYSSEEHKKIGEKLATNFDLLLTVGVRARLFAEGALMNGMDESNIFQYEQVGRAGRELQAMLEPGDVVLIKASQGIRAERIVEEIMLEPERAAELLVRQDPIWKTKG